MSASFRAMVRGTAWATWQDPSYYPDHHIIGAASRQQRISVSRKRWPDFVKGDEDAVTHVLKQMPPPLRPALLCWMWANRRGLSRAAFAHLLRYCYYDEETWKLLLLIPPREILAIFRAAGPEVMLPDDRRVLESLSKCVTVYRGDCRQSSRAVRRGMLWQLDVKNAASSGPVWKAEIKLEHVLAFFSRPSLFDQLEGELIVVPGKARKVARLIDPG